MATVIRALLKSYRYFNEEVADSRTKDLFLIGSPWLGLAMIGFYLHFIHNLGPRIMANRQPFKLDRIMQMYNVSQIVLNAYVVYKALELGWLRDYSFICQPVDYSHTPRAIEIAEMVWFYFMVKNFDLLDTVFFVLRKKQSQISFLHVYHHTGMVIGSWCAVKYFAGGHVTFLGLVNSFVHVVMYSHYLATSMKIGKPWWKKHITQLQLIQFIILLFHFSQLLWVENCGFPIWPISILIPQNLFMIAMFGDFYYKAYIKKPNPRKLDQNGVSTEASNGKPKTQ